MGDRQPILYQTAVRFYFGIQNWGVSTYRATLVQDKAKGVVIIKPGNFFPHCSQMCLNVYSVRILL